MKYTIDVYNDPGHGWGKVPIRILKTLGITDKITTYSYYRNGFAFLEEDCDMTTFIHACKEKGIILNYREHHTNRSSKIRNYEGYDKIKAIE